MKQSTFSSGRINSLSDEARQVLGGVLETFSEGHDTADLRTASEQMIQLSRRLSRSSRK